MVTHSSYKKIVHQLAGLLFIFVCTASAPLFANESQQSINRDPCMKCHKRNGKMLGLHGNEALDIRCSDCHGEKGIHPKKGNTLTRFGLESATLLPVQRQACMACHDASTLSEIDWTHDVHADDLVCAACHQLHAQNDPMADIQGQDKPRSQLCRRCHLAK